MLDFIFKHEIIPNYKIRNKEEYQLLYKYETKIRKLKAYKLYAPDICCLENAFYIKNNTAIINYLMKTITPNSECLSNALTHPDNKVVTILLESVSPSKSQILDYCLLTKNKFIYSLLVAL
jgi:hypothetical protein